MRLLRNNNKNNVFGPFLYVACGNGPEIAILRYL